MRHRSEPLITNMNVTAFLSVMVVLLFLFLAKDGQTDIRTRPPVDLAKVNHPVSMSGANREDALIVSVSRDGKVYLGNDQVVPSDLCTAIRKSLNAETEKKIYINADARSHYSRIMETLPGIRCAGIDKIGLLVGDRNAKAPGF